MAYPNFFPRHGDGDNNLLAKIARSLAAGLGQHGVDVFTSGTHEGQWSTLHALTAATVTVVRDGIETVLTLIAGDSTHGVFTSVTVTSGTVELFRV